MFRTLGAAVGFMIRILERQATPKCPMGVITVPGTGPGAGPRYAFTSGSRYKPLKFRPKTPPPPKTAEPDPGEGARLEALAIKIEFDAVNAEYRGVLTLFYLRGQNQGRWGRNRRRDFNRAQDDLKERLCCKEILAGPLLGCRVHGQGNCNLYPKENRGL